ncbi:Uncharacterised protein [Bordetella pertussis]|nr:Uncharacterised protein [Bordetella pertussis]CPM77697.1 Uncharacterised protein [Bordetella pertussis]
MMGACPTMTTSRPPTRNWYFSASGTTGTEPVTRIASYSVEPQPLRPSPVSTLTSATLFTCRFCWAKVARRLSISTVVTCCAR